MCHMRTSQAEVIATLLNSTEPEDFRYALRKLRPIIEAADGKLLLAAKQSGISHRSLCRWQADFMDVAIMIADIRKNRQQ